MTIFRIIESGVRGDRWKISNFFIPSVNGPSAWKNWKCDFINFHQNLNFSNRFFQKIEIWIWIIAFTQTCPRPASSRPEARYWLPSGCDEDGRCTPVFYTVNIRILVRNGPADWARTVHTPLHCKCSTFVKGQRCTHGAHTVHTFGSPLLPPYIL